MNNNLGSLNNYLFEQLERLNDDESLQQEELFDKEIKRSKAIINTAKTIIDNAKTVLDAQKYQSEYGVKSDVPEMLQIGTKK